MSRRISRGRLKKGDWSCEEVVGVDSDEVVRGLDGAVRARGRMDGGVMMGAAGICSALGSCVLVGGFGGT